MKRFALLPIAALVSLISACGPDTTQLKSEVDALDKTWASATESVNQWIETFKSEKDAFTASLDSLNVPEEMKSKLKPADAAKLDSLAEAARGQAAGFEAIQEEVNAFVSDWTEKGDLLSSIKEQLAAGKIDIAKATQEVASLATLAGSAGSTLEKWNGSLTAAKDAANSALEAFSTFKQSLMGAKGK
jgi:hypothetical protein